MEDTRRETTIERDRERERDQPFDLESEGLRQIAWKATECKRDKNK